MTIGFDFCENVCNVWSSRYIISSCKLFIFDIFLMILQYYIELPLINSNECAYSKYVQMVLYFHIILENDLILYTIHM